MLLITKFAYNNTKNTSISYTLFKLNYGFYHQVLFKENVDSYFKFRLANKLANKLSELIKIYCQNLLYIQKLQKKAYDKGVKSHNYALSKKV